MNKLAIVLSVLAMLVAVGAFFIINPKASLGAVTGPDSFFPVETHNGVGTGFYRTKLSQGTTTVCSFKNGGATSTVARADINFTTGSSSAMYMDIGVATTQYSTTTIIGTYNIAGSAQAFVQASTAPATGAKNVVGPNQYINFKVQGGTTGGEGASAVNSAGFIPVGFCSVKTEII